MRLAGHRSERRWRAFYTRLGVGTLALSLLAAPAGSAAPLPLEQLPDGMPLGSSIEVLEDSSGRRTLEEIRADSDGWRTAETGMASFGYTDSAYWLRFRIENDSDEPQPRMLRVANHGLDQLEIYAIRGDRIETALTGDARRFSQRPSAHREFLFPITVAAGEQVELYVRAKSTGSLQIPLELWTYPGFYQQDQKTLLGFGILFGVLGMIILYNLVLFAATRQATYGLLVLFALAVTLNSLAIQGTGFQFLWPESPGWNQFATPASMMSGALFVVLLARNFLQLGLAHPLAKRIGLVLISLTAGLLLLLPIAPFPLYHWLSMLTVALVSVTLVALAWWRWQNGFTAARYYLVGWGAFFSGVGLTLLNRSGAIPANVWTENGVAGGMVLMLLGFSLALADRAKMVHDRTAVLSDGVQRQLGVSTDLNPNAERFRDQSPVDDVTGLANRRRFAEVYTTERRRNSRMSRDLSLLMIDVDDFQRVIAEYGIDTGSVCLRVLGDRFQRRLSRPGDLVARFGSEIFTVLLPNTTEEGAQILAESIRTIVESKPVEVDGDMIELTVSIGMATEHGRPNDWRDLLGAAESALLRAQQAGRNRVELADLGPAAKLLAD